VPVEDDAREGRLDGGDGTHRGGQQPRPQRPQHGDREDREPDLTGQGADGEGDPGRVGTAPPLHRERADGDQQRAVQHEALRTTAVEERDDDRHRHGSAAHEDARYGRLGGALGGDDGQVEADHAYSREQRQPGPPAGREPAQALRRPAAGEREEQHSGQSVAQELAARVRVVAEQAVGGEGASDEHAGECGEQGAATGGVHDGDARDRGGPV
jgi:hypothetical protein